MLKNIKPDSINVTVFTKRHFWWEHWDERECSGNFDYWHHEPNQSSSGGTGFSARVPILGLGLQIYTFWRSNE